MPLVPLAARAAELVAVGDVPARSVPPLYRLLPQPVIPLLCLPEEQHETVGATRSPGPWPLRAIQSLRHSRE